MWIDVRVSRYAPLVFRRGALLPMCLLPGPALLRTETGSDHRMSAMWEGGSRPMGREAEPAGSSRGGGDMKEVDHSSASKAGQACQVQGRRHSAHRAGFDPSPPHPSRYHSMPVT